MATGGQKRTRSERVAALELPPGQWERAWISLRRRDVLGADRPGAAAAAAVCVMRSAPGIRRFAYRVGYVPGARHRGPRGLHPGGSGGGRAARRQARSEVRYIFARTPSRWSNCGRRCTTRWSELTAAERRWRRRTCAMAGVPAARPAGAAPRPRRSRQFQAFRAAFAGHGEPRPLRSGRAEAPWPRSSGTGC